MEVSFSSVNERTLEYIKEFIDKARGNCYETTLINTEKLAGFKSKYVGKVRDMYICDKTVLLVTTDRQSAFDRLLTNIPFKGQVLNLISVWWFEQTKQIVPNYLIASPHPNVTIGKKCKVFPVEFVMRGFITGTTSTSLWTNYEKGVRLYCGHSFPDAMVKNQKLDGNKLTPTTKGEHDELISAEEVVQRGLMTQEQWDLCAIYAHKLFSYGQEVAARRGLILVDTKYEFGLLEETGEILLVDEIHTPDCSRYWLSDTYESKFALGEEPDNIDKEFLRRWYRSQCDPYKDDILPPAPPELVNELSRRYIMIYEIITELKFNPNGLGSNDVDVQKSIDGLEVF